MNLKDDITIAKNIPYDFAEYIAYRVLSRIYEIVIELQPEARRILDWMDKEIEGENNE